MTSTVSYEVNESVATIKLDDDKVNVLGPAMQSAINEALDRAEKDSAKAVVIAGPCASTKRLPPTSRTRAVADSLATME